MKNSENTILLVQNRAVLQNLAKEISSQYSIKLTRARERLATALGYTSFNHCMSEFPNFGRFIPLSFYVKDVSVVLDEVLLDKHQIRNANSITLFEAHGSPVDDLYKNCSFSHFMTFSLIYSSQHAPLAGIEVDADNDFAYKESLDKDLHSYLCHGVISDNLLYEMGRQLKLCRDAQKRRAYWLYIVVWTVYNMY